MTFEGLPSYESFTFQEKLHFQLLRTHPDILWHIFLKVFEILGQWTFCTCMNIVLKLQSEYAHYNTVITI